MEGIFSSYHKRRSCKVLRMQMGRISFVFGLVHQLGDRDYSFGRCERVAEGFSGETK